MVDIYYLGHSSFRIKGKNTTLVVDPYSSEIGLKLPKDLSAGIVLISHDHFDHNNKEAVSGNPIVINGPGEYEVSGVSIYGRSSFHDEENGKLRGQNTMYKFTVDGIRFLHLGDLGEKVNFSSVSEFDDIDVLMIPVGEVLTMSMKNVLDTISEIEPKIVIPMHYKTSKHSESSKINGIEEFKKKCGLEANAVTTKLSLAKEKLPEQTTLYIFE